MTKISGLDRQLMDLFVQEVKERASEIEHNLLAMENADTPEDKRNLQQRLLRIAHSLKGAAGLMEVRPVEAICHRMEDLLAAVASEDRVLIESELDLMLVAADAIVEAANKLESGEALSDASFGDVLKLLETGIAREAEALQAKEPASRSQFHGVLFPPIRVSDTDGSLRLAADRLDALLYRSDELIASRARIRLRTELSLSLRERARRLRSVKALTSEETAEIENGLRELAAGLAEDSRLLHGSVAALSREVRRARVQPFSEVCQGLSRMIREIGRASGKSAELHVSGGEIEIDRSILAGLKDALRHLIRNAIGHGIETPNERLTAGKREVGRITVSAVLFGDNMQVRVEDDGRGFNIDSIVKAARNAGLPEPNDEKQRLRLAFEPGVSTSAQITKLSGRGIGLDIVRNAVESMRGSVEVSHLPGRGATFVLTLPLTLATVRALEIAAGGQVFAIDTASVRRVLRVAATDLPLPGKVNILSIEDRSIRVVELASWLGLPGMTKVAPTDHVTILVVGPAGGEAAVIVDHAGREQELLVRSLGERLANLRFYNGGTVLPDGRIALLLNAAALAEAAAMETEIRTEVFVRALAPVKRKVLVVDDSLSIRTLQKLILEAAGYEVVMAADGTQAWGYLQEHGADVVVADVDMPEMDGFSLTQAIRQSASFGDLPVILVTGRETAGDRARGLNVGANAYIEKDAFDQEQFVDAVRQLV